RTVRERRALAPLHGGREGWPLSLGDRDGSTLRDQWTVSWHGHPPEPDEMDRKTRTPPRLPRDRPDPVEKRHWSGHCRRTGSRGVGKGRTRKTAVELRPRSCARSRRRDRTPDTRGWRRGGLRAEPRQA